MTELVISNLNWSHLAIYLTAVTYWNQNLQFSIDAHFKVIFQSRLRFIIHRILIDAYDTTKISFASFINLSKYST